MPAVPDRDADLNAAVDYLLRTACATLRVERGLLSCDRDAGASV